MQKQKEHEVISAAVAAAKSLQSCPTLRDPIEGSPPGSAVPGRLFLVGCKFLNIPLHHYFVANRRGKSRSSDRFPLLGL